MNKHEMNLNKIDLNTYINGESYVTTMIPGI